MSNAESTPNYIRITVDDQSSLYVERQRASGVKLYVQTGNTFMGLLLSEDDMARLVLWLREQRGK